MDEYLSEKEQIEVLREWWRENGLFVVAGLILGIGALVGWKAWENYTESRAEQASARFAALMDAVTNQRRDEAFNLSRELTTEYDDTPYSSQAALAMARLHMDAQEPVDAAEQLRWVLNNTRDDELAHIARSRLARVLMQQGRHGEALALIESVDGGTFASRYNELLGDIYAATGDTESARLEYGLALADFNAGVIDRNFVQMKLDALPVSTTVVKTPDIPEDADPESMPAVVEETPGQ